MKRLCILLVVVASCLWTWLPLAHASQSRPLPDFDGNGVVDLPDFLLFVGNTSVQVKVMRRMKTDLIWMAMARLHFQIF